MNPLLIKLKALEKVPIPASTMNQETYWLENKGTLQESDDAIVLNCFDPFNGNPVGGVAYVIYGGAHSMPMVNKISQQFDRHRTVITVNEQMAAKAVQMYGRVVWDYCLTPVKVLDMVQEGYDPKGGF